MLDYKEHIDLFDEHQSGLTQYAEHYARVICLPILLIMLAHLTSFKISGRTSSRLGMHTSHNIYKHVLPNLALSFSIVY